ncbi:phage shock protein A [Candidatus Scalindua japonica]|uniref:Phage shock protein A n=1 Tax=Candidatus Scalindua japonica TaxID=1284222 RepID=A0A286TYG1_9BACT|nr:hypothetical protein [Candidatus Scalindua japonica]GAX60922.1 phage shock protein A [Candidatus Scalindua japonica]
MNEDKEKRENLQYSYNRTLDIFKIANDNYLKRVQIIMVALQTGLFIALMRLLSPLPDSWKDFPLPIIVTIIGILLSTLWNGLHNKQIQYLELMKRYLRNLESELAESKVPMDYFNIESALSYHITEVKVEKIKTKIIGKEIRTENEKDRHVFFEGSEDRYPDKGNSGKMLGGLVNLESLLGKGALWFWRVFLFSLIAWVVFIVYVNPPCSR